MLLTSPHDLDVTDSLGFSYPLNYEYPNSITFSGVQSGLLVAYGSDNLIVVLIEGKHITAILKGHEHTVCSVSFDVRGPHIVSCDISAMCYFWYYQDSKWQNTGSVQLMSPFTSASWYSARREFCISCKEGLFKINLIDIKNFKEQSQRLCKQSCFCTFNFDGTLLASHNKKTTVSIFMFTSNPYLTQVVRHPSPVVSLDFHPSLPAFLTITKDNVLRIWRQSVLSTFACTSALKVPFLGYFVRQPTFFSENSMFGPTKPAKIRFLSNSTTEKIDPLLVDENGRILFKKNNPFINMKEEKDFGFRAVYKTNLGTESIVVNKNKITIYTKQSKRVFYLHTADIKDTEFAEDSFWLYTLDKINTLIIWPIFNPYQESQLINENAKLAVWKNSNNLIYLEESKLKNYDAQNKVYSDFEFPDLENCMKLFSNNGEIYAITKEKVISKEKSIEINEFSHLGISKPYNNQFIIAFGNENTNQINVLLCPSMTQINCENRSGDIKAIGVVSLVMFTVMTDEHLEFWSYRNERFECVNKIFLAGMKGLYCDSTSIGGRIICFNDTRLFSIDNGVVPLYQSPDITNVTVSSVGHIVVFTGKHFHVFPSWCITKHYNDISNDRSKDEHKDKTDKNDSKTDPNNETANKEVINKEEMILMMLKKAEQTTMIGQLPPDIKYLIKLTEQSPINYMISPLTYANPPEGIVHTVQATLFHLLECRNINNLANCTPEQIPAIPNQYTIPTALSFPDDFHNQEYKGLIYQLTQIKEDIDMFGYRYLLAIKENAWPPSYFALWLSFSQKQSQVVEHLSTYIDTNMLSKFYIPASIHQHSVLVSLVQHALQNMWVAVQKVENVAILYAALGQTQAIAKLFSAINEDQKSDFFNKNFKIERFRKSAIKNAYSSLSHGNFEMAATLFFVAGDIKLCINVITTKLRDPMLALLVLRLLTKSNFNSELMQEFLTTVDWNDDHIPVLISNLIKDDNVPNLLENMLLDKVTVKNITAFGDRRITLFELYYNITKKKDIVARLTMNLNQDGLAPLSNYIYGLIECPFETFRAIDPLDTQIDEIIQKEESEGDEPAISIDEITADLKIEQVKTFDFGGGGDDWDEDDIDDEWSDESDEENNSEAENIEEKAQSEEVIDENNESSKEKETNNTQEVIEPKETDIFEVFLNNLTCSLCSFFDGGRKDENAGEFAMRASSIANAASLLSEERRHILLSLVSYFIDSCTNLFLDSATIPITPQKLFDTVLRFFNVIKKTNKTNEATVHTSNDNSTISHDNEPKETGNGENKANNEENNGEIGNNNENVREKVENKNENVKNVEESIEKTNEEVDDDQIDLKTILKYHNTEFIHSVYNGSIVVSLWTYCQKLLVQLLDETVKPEFIIGESKISEARSFFDVDIASPRFPDSLPELLTRYTCQNSFQAASLERERHLIMLLIFEQIFKINQRFSPNYNDQFLSILFKRQDSMQRTLLFYEIVLGSPKFIPPPSDVAFHHPLKSSFRSPMKSHEQSEYIDHLSRLIDNEYNENVLVLQKLQEKSLQRQPYPAIFRNGELTINDKTEIKLKHSRIQSIAFMPLNKKLLIAATDSQLIKIDITSQSNPIFSGFDELHGDVFCVLSHPDYNLFAALTPTNILIFDYQQNAPIFNVPSLNSSSKIVCAAFSPNGKKLAVCTSILDIFSFDNCNLDNNPTISRDMKTSISAVEWINSDTSLAVAINNSIVIVNTLTKFNQPIDVKKEWGNVISLSANIRRAKLVFGTKNGYCVITDMKHNFEPNCIITLCVPIVSISNLHELCVVGTEHGDVVVLSTAKPKESHQFETDFKISNVIISEDMFMAAGDSSSLAVWNSC